MDKINIVGIVYRYPKGTKIKVYVADVFGGPGPVYLGQFVVDKRTIRHAETDQIWGDVLKEAMQNNGGRRLRIVRVELV